MNLFITGSNGMVGKNIINHIKIKKYNVFYPTRKELDLFNYDDIVSYIKDNNIDMIIHCAGKVGGIQANMSDKVGFLIDNFIIGKNVIMAAKECNIKKLLNLGSSCIYPRNRETPLKEEDLLTGELEPTNEGYAIAKIAVLKLCQYISEKDNTYQYKTLIPCNLYGKYDKFDERNSHLIPAVIKKVYEAKLNNQDYIILWGDGTARREFMYAEDLADLIFYIIENFDRMPDIMNAGLEKDYTILEYYKTIMKILDYSGDIKFDLTKPVGMKRKKVDITKQKEFGWMPKYSLEEGIKYTVNYFLNEIAGEKND